MLRFWVGEKKEERSIGWEETSGGHHGENHLSLEFKWGQTTWEYKLIATLETVLCDIV